MLTRVTDTIIEELITLACGEKQDPRCRHLLTHALHGLVRVAQVEQLQQMRLDVESATGGRGSFPTDADADLKLAAGYGNASTRPT
jgi:hypothetical protein